MARVWTRVEIAELVEKSDLAVRKGLVALYKRQTSDEQASHATSHHNGRGFNGVDAEFGSSLAEKVLKNWTLSSKQIAAARRMLKKYVGQLVAVANETELARVVVDEEAVERLKEKFNRDDLVNDEEARAA